MIYAILLVFAIVTVCVAGIIAVAMMGKPAAFAISIAGISTGAVIALFQFWPF
jgi:hypothetical protein